MAQNQLQDFFRAKKQTSQSKQIDWVTVRDDWIRAVNSLYRTIEDDYLKDAKAAGDVEITSRQREVTEPSLGRYSIQELVLRVGGEGGEEVVFSPISGSVVGAEGRIDIEGERGVATIVFDRKSGWLVILSPGSVEYRTRLNAKSLAIILQGIMRP